MSQECWYSSHFCDNRGFAFRIHRYLSKETKKTRNEYKLSLIMTFISTFYLYKCSHFLCSQACTCSYMSQECWYSSHFCDNHGFPFRIHRCLSKETKKTRNEYKLSLIMTFISKFYLYKCSHCLGSQACTCSCKSQECWYSWHLCDNHDFHPCIHQFLEGVENIKLQKN